jgi:nucleotide-binding universal stress UspA family protein
MAMTDTSSGEQPGSQSQLEEAAVVLAAVDTSPAAGLVIDVATRMVRRAWHDAQLHIVHVFRLGPLEASASARVPVEELVIEAREYLDYNVRVARRLCAAPIVGHLAQGDAGEEIVKRAWSLGADVVVVGANDPVGPRRWLFKSVAEKLVKHAPCAVLAVRHKRRPYVRVA